MAMRGASTVARFFVVGDAGGPVLDPHGVAAVLLGVVWFFSSLMWQPAHGGIPPRRCGPGWLQTCVFQGPARRSSSRSGFGPGSLEVRSFRLSGFAGGLAALASSIQVRILRILARRHAGCRRIPCVGSSSSCCRLSNRDRHPLPQPTPAGSNACASGG
ncbi:hypothetical protein VPH35_092345 [Triticum aestivum]